jgi:hypothetical protein
MWVRSLWSAECKDEGDFGGDLCSSLLDKNSVDEGKPWEIERGGRNRGEGRGEGKRDGAGDGPALLNKFIVVDESWL